MIRRRWIFAAGVAVGLGLAVLAAALGCATLAASASITDIGGWLVLQPGTAHITLRPLPAAVVIDHRQLPDGTWLWRVTVVDLPTQTPTPRNRSEA